MSEVVDTRIVEAKFDSAQFEKGVDKTVKKLDELKESLNLKNTGDSITQLANKTKEASEKTSSALEKLQHRFTDFTGMLKQKLLSSIADEIVGTIFKIKNAFEGLIHTLGSAQISYGMQRYVDIMGSVRTLVFSGVDQGTAYQTIERLGIYADQTSYSLDLLVSTMSKFKTAGAGLDTAERMVIGLSNAAASMGVNATDAARAYLNLQQAYSKGAMLQNDWISFESLPMVGEKFNQAILDAAVKMKTLEKQSDGTYKTINKIDKQVKTSGADSKGITAQNLGTKLSSRWFNKAVMEEVFGSTYYFNVLDYEEIDKKTGNKVDVSASKAVGRIKEYEEGIKSVSTEVKSEQDQLKAELEKGTITREQYAEQLSNSAVDKAYANLDDDFRKNAPDINDVKKELKKYLEKNGYEKVDYEDLYTKQFETYLDTIEEKLLEKKKAELDKALEDGKIKQEEYTKALEDFKKSNNLTRFGWEAYRAGQEARSFTDVLNTLKDAISRGWATSFELIFGKLDEAAKFFTALTDSDLAGAIYSIGEFRNAVLKTWSENGGRDALLEALQNIDALLGRILGRFAIFNSDNEDFDEITTNLGDDLTQATKDFRDFTERLDEWFTEDRVDRIQRVFGTISKVVSTLTRAAGIAIGFAVRLLETLSPVFDKVIENVDKIISKVTEIFNSDSSKSTDGLAAVETGLNDILIAVEPLIKPLSDVLDIIGDIVAFFAELSAGTFVSNIQFFTDTLEFIIAILGGTPASGSSVILDSLSSSVKKLGKVCSDAFGFVSGFFHNLYEDLLILFGLKERAPDSEGGYFENIKKYFSTNQFLQDVKAWFKKLPGEISKCWTDVWNTLTGKDSVQNRRFDQNIYDNILKNGGFDAAERYKKYTEQPLVKIIAGWLNTAFGSIFKAIDEWVTKELPKKISEIWNTIDEFFFGRKATITQRDSKTGKVTTSTVRIKRGFSKWLETAVKDVKKWITKDLPKAISDIWNTIDEFFFGKKVTYTTKNALTGKEQVTTVRIKEGFSKWLDTAIKDVEKWILDLPTQIKELWNKIIDAIFYTDADPNTINPETNEKFGPGVRIKNGLLLWLEALPSNIWKWITTDLPNIVKKIWNNILDFIVGPKVPTNLIGTPKEGKPDEVWTADERIKTGFWTWLTGIPGKVSDWVNEKGGWLGVINDAWDAVIGFIVGPKVPKEMVGTPKEGKPDEVWTADERIKTGFWTWVEGIAGKVKGWIDSAPTKISEIWNSVLDAIFGAPEGEIDKINNKKPFDQKLYDTLLAVNGKDAAEAYKKSTSKSFLDTVTDFIHSLGIDIGKILSELPAHIVEGWNFNVGLFDTLLSHITTWLDGKNNQQLLEQPVDDAVSEISEGIEDASGASPLLTAVISFGQSIGKLVTTTIPGLLSKAFTFVKTQGIPKLGSAIKELFGLDDNWWTQINESAETFGTDVATKIEELPDKIRSAVEAVKGFFSGETELAQIKKDIRKQFTVKDEDGNLQIVDPEGLKVALNAAEVQFRRARKDSGLWNAIKEIFGATGDVVKEIGPDILDGINSVLEWVGSKISLVAEAFESKREGESITDAITRTMTGKENEQKEPSALAQALGRIGETIKTLIIEIIPNFIKSGINVIAQEIPNLFAGIFGGGKDDANGKSIFDRTREKISEKFNMNNATSMLLGQNNALNRLMEQAESGNQKAEKVDDVISEYDEKYRKLYTDVVAKKSKTPEDEKLLSFYLERKRYYEELKKQGHETIVRNADDTAVTAVNNAQEMANGAAGIIKTLTDLAASDTLGTVAIIAAIGWVLHSLSDIASISDELGAPGYSAKWIGIGILLTAITTIFGYMTYLVATGQDVKFDKMSKMFGDLGNFLKELAWVGVILKGVDAAGDVAEAIGKKADATVVTSGAAAGATSALVASGTKLLDITAIVGAVSLTGSTIMESIQMWIGDLSTSFSLLEVGFESLSHAADLVIQIGEKVPAAISAITGKNGIQTFFNTIMHIFENPDTNVAHGNNRGKAAMRRYSDVDNVKSYANDIIETIQTITEITGYFSLIKNAFSGEDIHAKEISDALTHIVGLQSKMDEFADFANSDKFESFKYAIGTLGAALSMYTIDSNAKLINTEQIASAIDVICEMLGSDRFTRLATSLTESGSSLPDAKEIYAQSEKIIMIAKATASLGAAAETITDNTADQINELFTAISKLEVDETVTKSLGDDENNKDNKFLKIANIFGILGNAISTFAVNSKDLQTMNLEKVERTVNMTVSLMAALRTYAQGVFEKVFTGDASLESFGTSFAAFAKNMSRGLNSLSGNTAKYDPDKLTIALKAMSAVAGIYGQLMATIYKALDGGTFRGHDLGFSALVQGLAGEGGLANALGQFCEEISTDSRFSITDKEVKNMDRVFRIIKHLSDFAAASNGVTFSVEMRDLQNGLDSNNPFKALVKAIGDAKTLMTENPEKYDKIELFIDLFAKLIQGIAMLASFTKDTSSDLSGRWIIGTLVADLGTVFSSLHENIGSIETFFSDIDKLDLDKIQKANLFFEGIYYLASTIRTFADSSMFTGATNFSFFEWGDIFGALTEELIDPDIGTSLYDAAKTFGENFDAGLKWGIYEGKDAVIEAARSLAESITGQFVISWKIGSPSKVMEEFGGYLDAGLSNGITGNANDVISVTESLANAVATTFANRLGIHSPSEVFEEFGEDSDEGLANGIDKNSNLPAEAMGRTAEEMIAQYQAILDDPNATKQDKDWAKRMLESLLFNPKHLLGAKQQAKQNAEELKTVVEEANDAVISAVSEEEFKRLTTKTKKMSLFDMALNTIAPWGKFRNDAHMATAQGPARRIAYYLGNAIGHSVAKHKDDAESGLLSSIANSKLFEVLMTGVIPEFGTSMFAKLVRTIHNSDDLSSEANDALDKYADFKWGDVSTYIANAYLKDVFPNVFAALNEHGGFDFTADNFDFKKALFPFMSGLLADISEMSDDEETKKICSVFGNFISKIFDVGLNDEGDWSFATAKQNIHNNLGDLIGFVYSEVGEFTDDEHVKNGFSIAKIISNFISDDNGVLSLNDIKAKVHDDFGSVLDSVYSVVGMFTDDTRVKTAFGVGRLFANLHSGKGIFGGGPFDAILGETSAVTESMNNEFANFGSNISNMFGGLLNLPEDSLDLSPKITPVLEITDDFEAQAERANSLLNFGDGSIGGGGGSLNMPNTSLDLVSQIEIPQPIDYTLNLNQIQTGIEYLQQGINSVGNSLSSMRFIIQGKEMVWTIGPDMMEYIGYEQTAGPGRYN